MPSTKFRIQNKEKNAQIYIRFSIKRGLLLESKTNLVINKVNWNDTYKDKRIANLKEENINRIAKGEKEKVYTEPNFLNGFPKQNIHTKVIREKLNNLSHYIENAFENANNSNIEVNSEWLKKQVENFHKNIPFDFDEEKLKKIEEQNRKLILLNYLNDYYKERLLETSIAKTTNQKFATLIKKITTYQEFINETIIISEIDKEFLLLFNNWLINEDKLMENTANRTIRNLKTVLFNARENGIILNSQLSSFKVPSIKSEKVFLDFNEINQIKNAKIIGENELTIARDWLIIGCFLGQRVGDLMRLNKSMIYTMTNNTGKEFRLITITQEKTNNEVTFPLHSEVELILKKYDGNFPPIFSENPSSNDTLFNRYIKRVCEIAELKTLVKGKCYNEDLKRNEIKFQEKHKLVSSHICRRSFANNFYGDARFTTPQLMAITGHKSESVFLEYIGKDAKHFALKTAETFAEINIKQNSN